MKLKLYNTMSRSKEDFIPLMEDPDYKGSKKNEVGLYSCGPTVYRDPHIGNMRAYVCWDVLRNTLEGVMGYPLRCVMNLTDVGHLTSDADDGEDKMEKGASREKMTVWELADKYITSFKKYIKMLNIDQYQILCRATDHIDEQIETIKKLEEKEYTYIIPGDGVYMDTSKVENYGKLAKLDIEGLQQGARIENDQKKNKTDFGLRKFSPKGEKRQMERDSPRGKGFPGWHIECSAMSSKYLGDQFDIHTGGVDHISVHHTNEIAQAECALGKKPWVKYRMHNQFLNLGGKKQSKSEGGLVTIDTLVEKGFHPLDFRYLCLTAHYRNFLEYSEELLDSARHAREHLIKKVQKTCAIDKRIISNLQENSYEKFKDKLSSKYVGDALEDMMAALMDDLNVPQVLAILNQMLNNINKTEEVDTKDLVAALYRLEKNILKIGLFDIEEKEEIQIPKEVTKLADQRLEAKKAKDYKLADKLRDQIGKLGFQVEDTPEGYEIVSN